MVASTVPSLSWAERAKKAQDSLPVLDDNSHSNITPTSVPTKPPPVNFWDARKEQRAAAAAHSSSLPAQSLHSPPLPLLSPDPEDDPFVVRVPPNRDRHPVAVPTLDDSEAWPEVGKSSAPTVKPNKEKEDHERGEISHSSSPTASKKSEKKWIPLPAEEWQTTTDHRPRPHSIKNGHSHHLIKTMSATNGGNPPSTSQSRAHSGHNSVSQSRINSRSGSVQSSPRIPRNKRLPLDESGIPTPPDSNHPINIPLVLHPQPDLHAYAENNPGGSGHVPMAYPTPLYGPDNSLAPYYSHHHPFPPPPQHYRHPSAHSPSNASYRSSQDNTPPLYPPPPPIHYSGANSPYPVYPSYPPYDYGMTSPQPPYLYWNNATHESHQSYPIPGLVGHYQTHLPHPQSLPSPQMVSDSPSQNERSYIQHSTRVPLPPEESQAVAGYVPAAPLDSESNRTEKVIFGSTDAPDSIRSPAPESPRPPSGAKDDGVESKLEAIEKSLTLYTIGMREDEAESARLRSRTRSSKARSRTSTTGSPTAEDGAGPEKAKVIDLTDQETKWKFGSAEGGNSPLPQTKALQPSMTPATQASSSAATPLSSISGGLPFDVSLGSSLPVSDHPTSQASHGVTSPSEADTDESDAFRVKDYGYGFGTGKNPTSDGPRDPKHPRERRDKGERSDYAERDQDKEGDGERAKNDSRPRRGYGQFDRGYSGRRGVRGPNGYSRGFARNYHYRGGMPSHRPPPPPPQIPPPSQFPPPMLPMGETLNGYFPPQQVPPFIAQPYDAYPATQLPPGPALVSTPPMPAPRSQLPFTLDPTRYCLLGQLEYYLSPQNLVQDFYLRQQMDAKGWIPIATLANFNRVKQLTHDYQFVKHVLTLSNFVVVREDWVRMHGWESFVLPNAPASTVELSEASGSELSTERMENAEGLIKGEEAEHGEEEEEEEEEVVFVMGQEAGWSPPGTRRQT